MTDADETHPGRPIRVHVLTSGLKAVILLAVGGLLLIPRDPEHNLAQRGVLGTHPAVIRTLAFSPDLSAVAVAAPGLSVTSHDLVTGRVSFVSPCKHLALNALAYAPDGGTLAEGRDNGSILLHSAIGRSKVVVSGGSPAIAVLKFAPGGRTLAAADVIDVVTLWDLEGSRQVARVQAADSPLIDLQFTAEGRGLVVWGASLSGPRFCDLTTGRVSDVAPGASGLYPAVALAPDGRTLAIARGDGAIVVWELDAGRERTVLKGHRGLVWALAFASDGQRLASGGNDMTVRLWNVPSAAVPR
jgi:WD40 repeat protein